MVIGSLFSGIGGLELGLEWAGLGPTVWQVEKDPYCQRVLRRHWPEATLYDDITQIDPTRLAPVDLICGGFPCQDLSSAGSRKGLSGSRSGLWGEFLRIVKGVRPSWVVVENVSSGSKDWVDVVRRELDDWQYATLPVPLQANWFGAPHRRARVFVIGHTDRQSQSTGSQHAKAPGVRSVAPTPPTWAHEPTFCRVDDGLPHRMDRLRALGNAVVPQCAEIVGHVIQELMCPSDT